MVKTGPCFFNPYKKSGIFKINKNRESEKVEGVNCPSSIEVPEIPVSYNFTGARKMVTPIALMIPAKVRTKKFCRSKSDKDSFMISRLL